MGWLKIKKPFFLKCCRPYSIQQQQTILDWIVICDKKQILYENWWQPAKWLDWEKTPKNFLKQMCTKKNVMVTGILLLVWPHSFLNPSKTISSEKYAQQIDEMQLQHWQPALVYRKGPIFMHDNAWLHITQPMLQKLNELGHKVLPHLPYSPDYQPTTTSSSILTTS